MNRKLCALALVLGAPAAGAWVVACDDGSSAAERGYEAAAPIVEAGSSADAAPDAVALSDAGDASQPPRCGAPADAPPRLLLTSNSNGASELAVFNLDTRKVEGRLAYSDDYGTTTAQPGEPYLLGQTTDTVTRLDAQRPWERLSSWSVRGEDAVDGGQPNANPSAVIVPECGGMGYVLRYNRNKIAVIDTAKSADAGAPERFIDLAPLLQAADRDGFVEMTSAVYVPAKKRIYVLLGNVDFKRVAADGQTSVCADSKPTIVAIDATTGQLVSLGGSGPGGGIALEGYNPVLGRSLAYDAARDRLIVFSAGCNTPLDGNVAGPIQRRRIEEVDLGTLEVKTLLSLDDHDKDFPAGMVFVDSAHALVSFYGQAFLWDPSQSALGPAIAGGLDSASYDGKGHFVGARPTYVDGGPGPIEIVSVPFGADGGAPEVQKLGESPFTKAGGFLNGAEVWPQ